MVQDGRQAEATEYLLAGLTDDDGRGLCEDTSRCLPSGCSVILSLSKDGAPK